KPIVTGCVYNGRNKPPYELPEHKTRSTFKTDTHLGQGFNEVRFEDLKNQEEIRTIAQRDMNTLIKNNEAKLVLNDSSTAIYDNEL
ncbi:type VI secretion system tip protein VgrG, partial [Bacillus sp. SIMBA_154]|uniref:bacteriophage T4 gp5 trimerisation domain-containing protein n=1 Tax=Bacillus sp. SIMBA_154 TaxID=3080859 RepID=UPI00397C2978